MLRYLPHNQIDYQQWDACIQASGQAIVYGLSWYLDVVSPGWAALVAEQEGRYVAVMPLPEAHKFGLRYLRQPFFAQQLGLFQVPDMPLPPRVPDLLLHRYALISKYAFNTGNADLEFPPHPDLQVSQHHTHHLDLSPPYETLYRHYSRDRKLNLGRARKAGLTIVESQDIQPLIGLFRADAASRITGGAPEEAYELLERLFQKLQEHQLATLYYTRTATGEWDAGCLFVRYGQKIIYLFNAASVEGRRRNGRSLIIDLVIRQHAGQPLVFDFESPAAVPAIIRVYQGFGSRPVPFYTMQYNHLPLPLKWVKQVRQQFYQKVLPTFKPGLKD